MRRLAPLLSVVLVACSSVDASFVCSTSAQCAGGVCQATTHFCSFTANDCGSGYRYDRSAGDGLAGTCTTPLDAGVDLDAGDDAGNPSKCPGFTGIACESFEDPVTDPWQAYATGGGTFLESTAHAYRGVQSGHAVTPTTTGTTLAQLSYNALPATAPLYARAWVWADSPPSDPFQLIAFQQAVAPTKSHAISYLPNGSILLNDGVLSTESSSFELPRSVWVCLQLSVVPATAGSVTLGMNDVPLVTLTGNTTVSPATSLFAAGQYYDNGSTATPGYGFFIDEVAISASPIKCAD